MSDSQFKKFNFHKGLADICFEEEITRKLSLTIQQQLNTALMIRKRLFATGGVVCQSFTNLMTLRVQNVQWLIMIQLFLMIKPNIITI